MTNSVRRLEQLTAGEVATRSGVSVSAVHFWERGGLIASRRTSGNQRRFHRDTLRRIAFIKVSQQVGISLRRIGAALAELPADRSPTRADWSRLSRLWRADLDARIDQLIRLRDQLDSCIGCGCLSLRRCALYNPDDELAARGPGARLLTPDLGPG